MKRNIQALRIVAIAAICTLSILFSNALAQDTLYIYHGGMVVSKRAVLQIDSMSYVPQIQATLSEVTRSSITNTTAISGGTISSDGGAAVTARGVVWSTSQNPTVALSTKTTDGTGTGSFTSSITGLLPGTTYYLRAYATNIVGTAYSTQVSFTTTTIASVTSATGKVWMDRNLGASQVATSSTDAQAYGDMYQWGRGTDGHEKRNSQTTTTLSSSDTPGNDKFIRIATGNIDWRSPQNNNLWQGVNGINNPCPSGFRVPTAAEWEAERTSWSSNNSAGAFASPLKLTVGGSRWGVGTIGDLGSVGYYWSATVDGVNAKAQTFGAAASISTIYRAGGHSVRCIQHVEITAPGIPTTSQATNITINSATSGGEISSDGGAPVTARGVVWSTNQNPTVDLSTKTTDGTGTGSFTSSITGLLPGTTYYLRAYATNSVGTVYGSQVDFVTATAFSAVTSNTGKVWMDRNLGASRVATSYDDAEAYGDLYQWGRGTDGHEKRNSELTSTLSSSDIPGNAMFITVNSGNYDWRSSQNNNLWQGVNGTNNPCPTGYRIPTAAEWNAESIWFSNSGDAFNTPLKLTVAGYRSNSNGTLYAGSSGDYWTSTVSGTFAQGLTYDNGDLYVSNKYRARGLSVRCIQDN